MLYVLPPAWCMCLRAAPSAVSHRGLRATHTSAPACSDLCSCNCALVPVCTGGPGRAALDVHCPAVTTPGICSVANTVPPCARAAGSPSPSPRSTMRTSCGWYASRWRLCRRSCRRSPWRLCRRRRGWRRPPWALRQRPRARTIPRARAGATSALCGRGMGERRRSSSSSSSSSSSRQSTPTWSPWCSCPAGTGRSHDGIGSWGGTEGPRWPPKAAGSLEHRSLPAAWPTHLEPIAAVHTRAAGDEQ
jgi:hypothetical protein